MKVQVVESGYDFGKRKILHHLDLRGGRLQSQYNPLDIQDLALLPKLVHEELKNE